MSNAARAMIGVAAIAVAVVLFVVLQDSGSDDDSDSATTVATSTTTQATGDEGGEGEQKPEKPDEPEEPEQPEIPTVEVKDGEPVGGVAELEFDKGDDIEFYVQSDVADHVHLHGYDIFEDVPAGERIKFSLPASIEGVFEAELEDQVIPIAQITVNP